MKRTYAFAAVALLALVGQPITAEAQVSFGPQVSFADDLDIGLGARVQADFTDLFAVDEGFLADVFGIASFDYYFDCGTECSAFELTADAAYGFDIGGGAMPYAGTGLSLQRVSAAFSNTELALNLMGGVMFPLGGTDLFLEARLQPNGLEQFILQAGVLFGGGGGGN